MDPKTFFTPSEKAIWRNLAMWLSDEDDGWIDLPGPASWWQDDDFIDSSGFSFFPSSVGGHREAMELVYARGEIDWDMYARIFPSDSELRVLPDDSTTRLLLQSFGSLG